MIKAEQRNALGYPGVNARVSTSGAILLDVVAEVAEGADDGTEYALARLPSNARIHGVSRLYVGELGDSNSPTLDVGLASVDGRFDPDDDALHEDIAAHTTAKDLDLVSDPADWGKMVWELAGEDSDPGGFIDITATIGTADADQGGPIALSLAYSID